MSNDHIDEDPRKAERGSLGKRSDERARRPFFQNTSGGFGLVAIVMHWLVTITVIGMFVLGLWMSSLESADPDFGAAVAIHKGVGFVLFLVLLFQALWRIVNPRPAPESSITQFERRLAQVVHSLLIALLFALTVSGIVSAMANGEGIDVFSVFEVPAIIEADGKTVGSVAQRVHLFLAILAVVFVAGHSVAALKHHFISRNEVLVRMLRVRMKAR